MRAGHTPPAQLHLVSVSQLPGRVNKRTTSTSIISSPAPPPHEHRAFCPQCVASNHPSLLLLLLFLFSKIPNLLLHALRIRAGSPDTAAARSSSTAWNCCARVLFDSLVSSSMLLYVPIWPKQAKFCHACIRCSRAGLSGSLGSPSGRLSNAPIRIEIGHLVHALEVQTLRVSRRRGRIPHLMGEIFNRTQLFRHRSRPAVAHGLILCSPS